MLYKVKKWVDRSGKMKKRPLKIGQKIIIIFTSIILLMGTIVIILSINMSRKDSLEKFEIYFKDITSQTSNSLNERIYSAEDITYEILTNSGIQHYLPIINEGNLDEYEFQLLIKYIRSELELKILNNNYIKSLSVVSDSGEEIIIQKEIYKDAEGIYDKDQVYEFNGSSVWGLIEDGNDISVQRAILDLKTMCPIGYINLIFDNEYISNVIEKLSTEYDSFSYIVDSNGKIISSNKYDMIGEFIPREILHNNSRDVNIYANDKELGNVIYRLDNILINDWSILATIKENELTQQLQENNRRIMFISLIAIVVSIIIGVLLIKKLTEPTKRFLQIVNAFGKGDLTKRIEITSNDEIGQMSNEFNNMADKIETLIDKVLLMEISQKQAEIDTLRMQINPHFLYNTLDTINWTAIIHGEDEISEMVIALGDLLRANLKSARFITVKEELESVKNFLSIQEYRFGNKIKVNYEVEAETLKYIMPNFLLQPIVENAITHGLEPLVGSGNLLIEIKTISNKLFFKIKDNGVGMSKKQLEELYVKCVLKEDNEMLGIKNVYRRLKLIYGDEGEFQILSKENNGTEVIFIIPLEYERNNFIKDHI